MNCLKTNKRDKIARKKSFLTYLKLQSFFNHFGNIQCLNSEFYLRLAEKRGSMNFSECYLHPFQTCYRFVGILVVLVVGILRTITQPVCDGLAKVLAVDSAYQPIGFEISEQKIKCVYVSDCRASQPWSRVHRTWPFFCASISGKGISW